MRPMTLADILDRYTITELKVYRISEEIYVREYNLLYEELYMYWSLLKPYIKALRKVNARIWDLEHAIRNAQEADLGLEEVGRRALRIRDANAIRIRIKNAITRKFGGLSIEGKSQYTKTKKEI